MTDVSWLPLPMPPEDLHLIKQWWKLVEQYQTVHLALCDRPASHLRIANGLTVDRGVVAGDGETTAAALLLAILLHLGRLDPASLSALGLVARERLRQIVSEGYSVEHDDQHDPAEFANAAAAYALSAGAVPFVELQAPACWPWNVHGFKSVSQDHDMVRSGALTVAGLATAIRCGEADPLVDEDDDVSES
ncbi:hypothetical protein ACIU1J_32195 [Azospirillum doebereinerae]|uniref:hypothetical protein n=1 Tax=Azospirillum doebereinerae TaxID=92933 RepID=UPI001EE4F108|nr:hypothetical protein [Azospirillum doebereinerae]MCG5238397.1 hypothetical protein [Azospirillum doebereinerae]